MKRAAQLLIETDKPVRRNPGEPGSARAGDQHRGGRPLQAIPAYEEAEQRELQEPGHAQEPWAGKQLRGEALHAKHTAKDEGAGGEQSDPVREERTEGTGGGNEDG